MGLLDRWQKWRLEGWDTFARHAYHIPGRYWSERAARAAAMRELRRLERMQPSVQSGGQDGIQDQVFVIGPGGERIRIFPED